MTTLPPAVYQDSGLSGLSSHKVEKLIVAVNTMERQPDD